MCLLYVLASGTEFDLCTAYFDFGDFKKEDFGEGKPFPNYAIIFRYSKDYWRFNLFGREKKDLPSEYFEKFSSEIAIKPVERPMRREAHAAALRINPALVEAVSEEMEILAAEPEEEHPGQISGCINIQALEVLSSVSKFVMNQACKIQQM